MFTLREANLRSPEAIQNRIVRQLQQIDGGNRLVTSEIFPLVELSDSRETHFTMDGLRTTMRQTDLASESPVGDIGDLGERDLSVSTFKKKIQAEKGVDTELNSQREILNLFNAISDALMEDVLMTRAQVAWQGTINGDIDGIIGTEGATAHPEIPSSHVLTPSTAYSDSANSTPLNDFIDAESLISQDGSALEQAGSITAYMSPNVVRDMKLNDDLASDYDSIAALTEQQLADSFQIDRIRPIRTQLPRFNSDGEPVDASGDVVADPANAARDNVLEPHDGNTNVRNIVITAPGQASAFMPWFLDRLNEMGQQAPHGDVSVDSANGWMTQTWTENDPLVTWFAAKQEIGFHIMRGDNFVVIQDI